MKRKWLVTMITSMLAVSLVTGCGMNNNDRNEPVDEVPTDRNVDDQNLEDNTDREINDRDQEKNTNREFDDENLRDRDNLDDEFNNDRTNENNMGDQ